MGYKFEQLEVWQESLDYVDQIYELARELPRRERYNLAEQMKRAANSISLNIAEGSTGLTDAEQRRFLQIAIRSLLETVACVHLVKRREYVENVELLRAAYRESEALFAKLQAFRSSLDDESTVEERSLAYSDGAPF